MATNNIGDIAGKGASPGFGGLGYVISQRNAVPVIQYPEIIPSTINSRDHFGNNIDIDNHETENTVHSPKVGLLEFIANTIDSN